MSDMSSYTASMGPKDGGESEGGNDMPQWDAHQIIHLLHHGTAQGPDGQTHGINQRDHAMLKPHIDAMHAELNDCLDENGNHESEAEESAESPTEEETEE